MSQTPKKWEPLLQPADISEVVLTSFHHLFPATNEWTLWKNFTVCSFPPLLWIRNTHVSPGLEEMKCNSTTDLVMFVCNSWKTPKIGHNFQCYSVCGKMKLNNKNKNKETWSFKGNCFQDLGEKKTCLRPCGRNPWRDAQKSSIPITPLSIFSSLKKAWLPILELECVLFMLLGFAEDNVATIKWLGYFHLYKMQ